MLQVNKFYYYSFIHFVSRVVQKYMCFYFILSLAMKYYILLYLTMVDILNNEFFLLSNGAYEKIYSTS